MSSGGSCVAAHTTRTPPNKKWTTAPDAAPSSSSSYGRRKVGIVNVRDLIKALQQLDPEMPVVAPDGHEVTRIDAKQMRHQPDLEPCWAVWRDTAGVGTDVAYLYAPTPPR